MAGFVLLAVLMRPVGGWLSDRFGAVPVLTAGYAVVVAGAAVQPHADLSRSGRSPSSRWRRPSARQRRDVRAGREGRAGGQGRLGHRLVGAAGGLGGFVPPLVMGAIYSARGTYGLGLALLAVVALATLVLTVTVVRTTARGAGAGNGASGTARATRPLPGGSTGRVRAGV
jgi:NNP family nitrate/nitrite transporter-like MFS transporter